MEKEAEENARIEMESVRSEEKLLRSRMCRQPIDSAVRHGNDTPII